MRSSLFGALVALTLTFVLVTPAQAFDAFTVDDIEIRGDNRIAAGTVLNYLPVRTGERFAPGDSAQAIRSLYQTGLFRDVELKREGNTLIVVVRERPAIAEINIEGDFSIEEEKLRKSVADLGIAAGRTFNRSLLDQMKQAVRQQLYSRGKYGMEMEVEVRDLERNRVAIDLTLREGKTAKIRQIKIIGNEVYSDETLKDQMESGIPSPIAFLSSADEYSRTKLQGDLEAIRSWYLDRGYTRFSVTSSQVTITPDKKDIYITINVDEGVQYNIDEIELAGDFPVEQSELRDEIEVESGQLFSRKAVTASETAISDRLAQSGFAFAQVNVVPRVDEENRSVDLEFFIKPGNRTYVRRISFSGQTDTADRVFRRELRQTEGGLYSPADLERSRVRLQRLPQVQNVSMERQRVPGSPDTVDITYDIEARSTGSFSVGAGYSTNRGVTFSTSLRERNLLGTGKDLTISIDTTQVNRTFEVRYTDPYYTEWGVSRSLRFVYTESDPNDILDTADYFSDSAEVGFDFGVPLSEYNTFSYGFGVEGTRIRTTDSTPDEIQTFLDRRGTEFLGLRGRASLKRDTRNRTIFAESGTLQELSLSGTLPGSDLKYYKLGYSLEHYIPITERLTFSGSVRVGYGSGYGDALFGERLPFFRRYYAGGIRSVRGYEGASLGPEYPSTSDPSGGDFLTNGSLELIFPPPLDVETGQTRLSVFVDFGNVFADVDQFEAGVLRASAGVAFNWRSPIGPLSFSLAEPLNAEPGDELERFQFTIGTLF